tara:strand:+ start:373 stop:732 length:360 start_codon:yes stop_codon:yes gene_type:complete
MQRGLQAHCGSAHAIEIRFLQELVRLAASEPPDETDAEAWLTSLPIVVTQDTSLHVIEQLVVRIDVIDRLLAAATANDSRHTRAAVCVAQLRGDSRSILAAMQSLQTAVATIQHHASRA